MLTLEQIKKVTNQTVQKFLEVQEDPNYIIAPEVVLLATDSPLLKCVSTPTHPQNLVTKTFKEDFPDGVFVFRTRLPNNWRDAKFLISFEGCLDRTPNDEEAFIFIQNLPYLFSNHSYNILLSILGDLYKQIVNELNIKDCIVPDWRKDPEGFNNFVIKVAHAISNLKG